AVRCRVTRRAGSMRLIEMLVITLLFPAFGTGSIEDNATVQGVLAEKGQPMAGGLVVLQRLKNERCAKLFDRQSPSPAEIREGRGCEKDLPWLNTNEKGSFLYPQLPPGWYNVRFLWLMRDPPPGKAVICNTRDWTMVLGTERDRTGKYNAMAQGKPFELKANESKRIDFDYRQDTSSSADCAGWNGPAQPPRTEPARMSIPGIRGVLELNPGATLSHSILREENVAYLEALGRSDHLLVTAFLQHVSFTATPEKCRDERWPRSEKALRTHGGKLKDIQQ